MASHAAKEKRPQWALRSNVRDGGHSLQFGDVRVDSALTLKADIQRKSRHVPTTNFDPAALPSRWTGMGRLAANGLWTPAVIRTAVGGRHRDTVFGSIL